MVPARLSFSIVINTLNRAAYLRNCLSALRYLRHPRFEVIVVNGPSTDDTEEVMAEFEDLIRIGRCDEANLSKSRNIGIRLAQGDIVCFLDDDAYPEPDWLNRLEEAYSDPDVGAVGGYIRDHSGVNFQCRITVCDRFGDAQVYNDISEVDQDEMGPGTWSFISQTGANSSFRREALLKVGGFDEYFVYFLDETDVNLRIRDAGYRVSIAPNAEVHHKYAPSHLRDHSKVPTRLYYPVRSKAYYCVRHARKDKSLRDVMAKLSEHTVEINRHNKWYVDNGVIDREHYEQLVNDVDQGLLDGVRDAMKGEPPVLLDKAAALSPMRESFKPFTTLAPTSRRLRLCFLSQEYPPAGTGGIGTWTAHMAREIAARGHEVSVVTKTTSGEHTVDFEDGVWVHRIKPSWHPRRTSPALGSLPQTIKDYAYSAHDEVMRIHLRRGLDLVSAPIWDLEGAACLAAENLPVVTSLHTTFQMALPFKPEWSKNKQYLRKHVNKIIDGEKAVLARAPHVMANSRQILVDLMMKNPELDFGKRATIIHHGIPSLDIRMPVPGAEVASGKVRFLFVGRLEPRKGADVLLKAIPRLMEECPKATFDIVGDDSQTVGGSTLREAFERRNARADWLDRVTFHGFLSEEELEAAYRGCDVFVAPSRYESFGLVFLEAMRYGKPCIGTEVGGIQEVVEHETSGVLVKPGKVKELAQACISLANDPAQRQTLGRKSLERFQAHFTSEKMIDDALAYYHRVLSRDEASMDYGYSLPELGGLIQQVSVSENAN